MTSKNRAKAKNYVRKLAQEPDVKFIKRSLSAFLTVSNTPSL